uniref:ATP synthase complex subunit 8 n=1 Tax=Crypsis chinensis TaxID=2984370 RepID=A0A978B0K7_9CUCU|nr:ATP synthase F0 subunit 8 [Crypsis chinensis]UYB79085.1 ATP synthase F0 subunit 8 [Crypsis chinensis]
MPQMAPLSWTFLVIMTLTVLAFMTIMNYFNSTMNPLINKNHNKKLTLSWKW